LKKHAENLKTKDQNSLIRLNKYISNCGICSRRNSDILIKEGKISINNKVITNPATKINPSIDYVYYNNKRIKNLNEEFIYLVFNKPAGCICSTVDTRTTVFDYLPNKYKKTLINVGRLDYNSEGILLFTNDKPMINRLTHPKFGLRKLYLLRVSGIVPSTKLNQLETSGIVIENEKIDNIKVFNIRYTAQHTWLEIEIGEGKNRELRKIFEKLGYTVSRLKRIAFGNINKNIPPKTKYRLLNENEIAYLKSI